MESKETVIYQKLHSNLNLLIEKTSIPSLIITLVNQKKRKYEVKKIKPYNTTRIKSRTILTNISYNKAKEEDLIDRSFAFNIYVLTTKNINPFSLERIIFDVKDREMINMFWEDSICQPDNFLYLHGKNIIYPRVAEIVMNYIEADENNFGKLRRKLIENQKIFKYLHASIYTEVYSFLEKGSVDMISTWNLKSGKIEKNIHKNRLTDTFPQKLSPSKGAVQKNLVINEDSEEEKKSAEEQKQKEMEEKKQKKKMKT